MKACNVTAEKSKEWLIASLIKLMEHKPFEEITILDITDNALLTRRTFYRHFKRKEDLLSAYFKARSTEYILLLAAEDNLKLPSITRVFFTFMSKHLDFLYSLQKNDLLFLLLQELNDLLPQIYGLFKGKHNEYPDQEALKYALAFSLGGYWNVLSTWLKDGAKKSPDELAEIITQALRVNTL